jgi:hypothetical protein
MVVAIPGTDHAIVLLDYMQGADNLVRIDAAGTVQWRTSPNATSDPDGFVAARIDKLGILSANSWSGYFMVVDLDLGRVTSIEFTK